MRCSLVVVVAVVGFGACKGRSKEPPPPAPTSKPTPVDAVIVEDFPYVDDVKRDTLDRLYTYITTTKREKRSPIEAPAELTGAYVDLLFAYGYARLGVASRSGELRASAKRALATSAADPVHGALIALFEARIADALEASPPRGPLLPSPEPQLVNLDRVARYKVDRLREYSRVLAQGIEIDAIGAFAKRRADSRGVAFEQLAGEADPAVRAKIVGEILEAAPDVPTEERGALLTAVLAECIRLPAADAMRMHARVLPLVDALPAENRARVLAKAIVVAHKFDRARLRALAKMAAPTFGQASPFELAPALWDCVRSIGNTHKDELRAIWTHAERTALAKPAPSDIYNWPGDLPVAFAAGLVQLREPRGTQLLDELAAAGPDHMTIWMDTQRGLPSAYAYLAKPEAMAAIERVARGFPRVTDSFGTNSHFTLYVLAFVDALVVGVVDE